MNENISAISTARGVGGVAIVRVSGDTPLEIAKKMFIPLGKTKVENFEQYKMYTGEIDCGSFKDFGMCVYFKGPKSYTGEDMVEFHCHGGIAVSEGVLKATFKNGARPATNGEFTKRAFLNGKLSLSSAEGLIDMINSESEAGVKAGYYLYREKLNAKIKLLQDSLTYSLAEIDANIDYPEEGLEEVATEKTQESLKYVKEEVQKLISAYGTGRKIKNGVKVAICGKPNTGKSSILNALLSYDKAIVSSVAGTTRDVVEGELDINGVNFLFFDTAGIRQSDDEIEKIGIDRSSDMIKQSDVCCFVVDGSRPSDDEDKAVYEKIKDKNVIIIINKNDEKQVECEYKADISVSAKTGDGIDGLKRLLYQKSFSSGIDLSADLLTEERHYYALKNALEYLNKAYEGIGIIPLDLISVDMQRAWEYLGEISGNTANENIINEIFSKFCVGK